MIDLNKIKKPDLWYTIGYIAADGSLSIDRRHINITSKDRAHLYLVRNALRLTNKIGLKARSSEKIKLYSNLQFGDVIFYKYLQKLGFTPNKSLTLGTIDIDNQYFIDFLRGVIDGDGNIGTWIHNSNYHRQWCLRIYSGSQKFINWLKITTESYFKVTGKLYARNEKNKNTMYILKFGKKNARIILQKIYYPGSLALERKNKLALLCLQ